MPVPYRNDRRPFRMPPGMPPFVNGPDGLISIDENQPQDEISVEFDDPRVRDFLFHSSLSTSGRLQLLRAHRITDPMDREALVKAVAYWQWWEPQMDTYTDMYKNHLLRSTMLKLGLSATAANQILTKQVVTDAGDRRALLEFITKLVPAKSSGGGGGHGAKGRGK
jgi:hypothetical protein